MSSRPNWPSTNSPTEVSKLQQHLALLKKEYVKLQNHCSDLEKKFAIASAREKLEDSFVSRLLETVAGLHKKKQYRYEDTKLHYRCLWSLYNVFFYSDIEVLLANAEVIPAHRFVLKSRSSEWGVTDFDNAPQLDWSEERSEVMALLLQWVYTGEAELRDVGDQFCMDLMKVSAHFHLMPLTNRCEQELLMTVGVHNCVKLYTTADEIGANTLRDHCSKLISVHWDDFTSEDFAHMSAPLLFTMLKTKTEFPLHSAIRLAREDVVFLYLVEHSAEVSVDFSFFFSQCCREQIS
ncbi:hypothetical protein B566_EDAN011232 [Ephemera danica]|nr:hypothetical protein B566_EDAN011232 [Ephemera danica]